MKRKIANLKWRIGRWMYCHSPIYISSLNVLKLFKEYKEARHMFKLPAIVIHDYTNKIHDRLHNKFIHIDVRPLMYKYKYGEPRHEMNPMIIIKLFFFFNWHIELCAPDKKEDTIYWESIIWYNDTKDIFRAYEENIWFWTDNNGVKHNNTCLPYLTTHGFIGVSRILDSSCYNQSESSFDSSEVSNET